MNKIVLIFMLLTPVISLADRRLDFIESVLEYEKTMAPKLIPDFYLILNEVKY